MKLILDEATYRNVGTIVADLASDTNFLKVDLLNEVIGDISDELYTITTKLEAVSRLAKAMGYKDCDIIINDIIEDLSSTLDKSKNLQWKELLDNIELYSHN